MVHQNQSNSRNKLQSYNLNQLDNDTKNSIGDFNPSELLQTLKHSRFMLESKKVPIVLHEERLLCIESRSSVVTLSMQQSDDEPDPPESEEPVLSIKKFPDSLISNKTNCHHREISRK